MDPESEPVELPAEGSGAETNLPKPLTGGVVDSPVLQAAKLWWTHEYPKLRGGFLWARIARAAPDQLICGDEDDTLPEHFADWDGILGRVCASEQVAAAAIEFERAHGSCPDLWRGLVVAAMTLPSDFMLEDPRTNAEKANALRGLVRHVREIARIAHEEAAPPVPHLEPEKSAQPLPVLAKDFDTPRGPAEYRLEQEWRKLSSKHRQYRPNLLEDVQAEPTRKGDPLSEIDAAAFGRIARRLVRPIETMIEHLSGPDLMQLSKGAAWHRYAVDRLEAVFEEHFGLGPVERLDPGPNKTIAAFVNAAVPAERCEPLSLRRAGEVRRRLSSRKNLGGVPVSA